MAVDIVINLRFYIDPDDSPWLVGLNETEKEERRRLFGRCEIGRSLGWGLQELSTDRMKLLRPIPGAFKEMHYYQEFCEVHSLIIAIKRHYSSAPNSIQDMLSSPELLTLHMQLTVLEASLPMLSLDFSFLPQSLPSSMYLLWMHYNHLSVIMMLHRSKAYLAAFDPSRFDALTHETIKLALYQTLESARQMISLTKYLLGLPTWQWTVAK
ncbi:hypothetical protein HDU79_009220, partial [Rhizoclosmatium sp. JEL0117]